MTLRDHLVELRNRLIKAFIAIGIGVALGWFLYVPVLNWLTHPLREICAGKRCGASITGGKLLLTDPLEGLLLRVRVSAYVGLLVAMPVILWQIWRFVAPGLYKNERRYAAVFVGSGSVLFAGGAAVAYYSLPKTLEWLGSIAGGQFVTGYSASKYLQLILYMMLIFGAAFQFPILAITAQAMGMVQARTLFRQWRYGIVVIAIVAALITPSSDPISMFALAIPLWIFYFGSAVIGLIIQRRKARRET
jgi:sec-independent protein translocase protein TatC